MKTKSKLALYSIIALSFALISYIGIRLPSFCGQSNVETFATKDVTSHKNEAYKPCTPNTVLHSPQNIRVPENVVKSGETEKFISETLKEITERSNKELILAVYFPQKDLKAYNELCDKIVSTNDIYDIIHIVDLVSNLYERYVPNRKDKEQIKKHTDEIKLAYTLIEKTLNAIKNSQLYRANNKSIELQELRLLVDKYKIEILCLDGIPPRDRSAAETDYARLQQMEPDTEIDKYQKIALLYQAQHPMLSNLTEVKSLSVLVNNPPEVSTVQDKIIVARIKTWALLERASFYDKNVPQLSKYYGQLYQYVIDSYGNMGNDILSSMTNYDKEYFGNLVHKAANGLSEIRAACQSEGIDIERELERRGKLEDFRL